MSLYTKDHLSAVWNRMRTQATSGNLKELPVGVDGMRCTPFENQLDRHLSEISRKILHRNDDPQSGYQFAPLLKIEKPKQTGGFRNLYIPRLRDQLVIRAMHEDIIYCARLNHIELKVPSPINVVKAFSEKIREFNAPVILRADIKSFYDSVPRSQVIEKATGLGINAHTIHLLRSWSNSVTARKPWVSGTQSDCPVDGLPQGLSISASLSELWAKQLDDIFLGNNYCYFRYVDDIAFICESENHANDIKHELETAVSNIGMMLSPHKTKIEKLSEGVIWLGLTHFPNKIQSDATKVEKWLRRFVKMCRNASTKIQLSTDTNLSKEIFRELMREINSDLIGRTSSRTNWYAMTDDKGQWKEMDKVLHALIRSVHRQIEWSNQEPVLVLPSVHRVINMKKQRT